MIRRVLCVVLAAVALGCLLCACFAGVDGETDHDSYTRSEGKDGVIRTYSYSATTRQYFCEGMKYAYCLTLTGTMPSAARQSTFVVLSNVKGITFEQAYLQLISSDTADFFDPQDAVVVEMR